VILDFGRRQKDGTSIRSFAETIVSHCFQFFHPALTRARFPDGHVPPLRSRQEFLMPSFEFDIGEQARAGSRFIAHVRDEIQRALFSEKGQPKITQQQIADKLGTSRSVINRQIMGLEDMTLRRVAEILWAIGWEPYFGVRRCGEDWADYHKPADPESETDWR
jgi:HTH domain